MNPEAMVYTGVKMTCQDLTDAELAAINLAVSAGFDPRKVHGYDKANSMFTESGGTKMHPTALAAFQMVVNERLATV